MFLRQGLFAACLTLVYVIFMQADKTVLFNQLSVRKTIQPKHASVSVTLHPSNHGNWSKIEETATSQAKKEANSQNTRLRISTIPTTRLPPVLDSNLTANFSNNISTTQPIGEVKPSQKISNFSTTDKVGLQSSSPSSPNNTDIELYFPHPSTRQRPALYHTQGLELYLHAAHYDTRFGDYTIRTFGIESRKGVSKNFTCRYNISIEDTATTREVRARKVYVDKDWPDNSPYLAVQIDCSLPRGVRPGSLSLGPVESPEQRVEIPVNYYKGKQKRDLVVCVKPVTGRIDVGRLVEWFEMFRAVGVQDFIIYTSEVQGNAKYVLDYYVEIGILRLVSFPFLPSLLDHVDGPTVGGTERYGIYQQSFLVALQDCLYRYHHLYNYMLVIDLDEVLLPTDDVTLQELVHVVHRQYPDAAAMMFLTAWHFEDLTEQNITEAEPGARNVHLRHSNTGVSLKNVKGAGVKTETRKGAAPLPYMQRHVVATLPLDVQPKSVVVPNNTVTINFHGAHDVPDVRHANVNIRDYNKFGYVHHFRGRCSSKFEEKDCRKMVERTRLDAPVLRYRDRVTDNVQRALEEMQLKP